MNRILSISALLVGVLVLVLGAEFLTPELLGAQEALSPATTAPSVTPGPLAQSPQMRHFWHVFAAYAIAWALIFGWAVSIVRRIRSVEARLEALGGGDLGGGDLGGGDLGGGDLGR
jgi:CcmD family protein